MFENPLFHFLVFFSLGCLGLAFMDLIQDLNEPDSGFWSRKTGANKNDAWHWAKRVTLAFFAWSPVSFLPEMWLYILTYCAIIAIVVQVVFYNFVKIIILHIRAKNL
jgi:hypothetical protein